MTKMEVNGLVAEAIEELRMAQMGRPLAERTKHREKAGEILGSIKRRDLAKVSDELASVLLALA